MNATKISWCDFTWNVWSGCEQISPGCAYCYAKTLAENKRGTAAFPKGFDLTYRWHKLNEPLKIKTPSLIFVNSMSDLYLEDVPLDAIKRVFDVMNRADTHQFQVLTKRSKRLLEISDKVVWTPNIWQGVSVENQHWASRIDDLIRTPAAIKFISAEPLLGPLDLSRCIDRLDWIIAGGESDPKGRFRKMDLAWARDIRDLCAEHGTAFFYKQGNGYRSETEPHLDGVTHHALPSLAARRERQYSTAPAQPLLL